MKPTLRNRFLTLVPAVALGLSASTFAADRYWDGGTVAIATNGDGASSFLAGTWNTTLTNWDQGAGLSHLAWVNANLDTAIFGGTLTTGTKVITLGASVTVNQLKILTGDPALATSANRYDIGVASDTTNAITFGGTYNDTTPAIDASAPFVRNNNFPAKVTGTLSGGLVIKHGSDSTNPSSGRFALTNPSCDFVGDVILTGGNLSSGSQMGNAANKLVLKGGSLFVSNGGAVTITYPRNIDVATASGLNTNAASSGLQVLDLTGTITGSANLTRYANVSGSSTSEIRFSGSMSGFTGTFENVGPTATSIATIQTTATSGGAWKLTGGTLKFNTTDDTHIANGTGKSDLLMNGGTLNMNGKAETINGLAGATGFVQNALTATTGTLTVGDGDVTATFGGQIGGGAGTVALTKIGSGTQTLAGANTYTGATTVNAGKLILAGSSGLTPVTVATGATFGVKEVIENTTMALPSLATGTGAGSTIQLDTASFGTVTSPVLDAGAFTPGTGATTLLRLKGFNFIVGTMPLIKYTALAGAGFAGLAPQLPYRVVGTLENNTAASTIDLKITSAESAIWNGDVSGDWDVDPDAAGTAGALNWKTSVGGSATRYAQGPNKTDQVTFNNNATGTRNVNLTTTLTPLNVLVDNTPDKTYTFTGPGKLSGETALVKDNTGTLILANAAPNDYTGGTTVLAGTLRLGDGTAPGAGRISGPVRLDAFESLLAYDYPDAVTVTNAIAGSGKVLKLGTNTLTFNAANTFSGGLALSSGTVVAATNAALGTGEVALGDATTGTRALELTLDNRVDVANAVWVSPDGTGTATLAASNTGTGTANPASFTGTVTLDRATIFRSDIVGDRLAFTGRVTTTALAPVALTIAGGQNVTLQSTFNDFTGSIAVTGAGTVLQASHNTAVEVLPDAVSIDLATGTFLKLYGSGSNLTETIAGLTGTGTVVRHEAATTAQTLAVGSGDVSSVFDGVIRNNPGTGTGTLGLRKIGTGTFTLNGVNTYTGFTTVAGGTLLVNGSIAGPATVDGGTLGGSGTVAAITATTAGKVSPATTATIGTLNAIGNVSFATGTEYTAQINSNGEPATDKLAVAGTLALGTEVATLNLTDLGTATLTATTKLVLATATGAITGAFSGRANNSDVVVGSNTYKIKYDDTVGALNAITLTFTAAGGYSAWATTHGVGAANADDDNDGVKNGVEYVLGTDPKVASANGITVSTTATEFIFTFTRSDASETSDTSVVIETSNDLVNWTADASPYAVGVTGSGPVAIIENPAAPAADPGTDTVTLTVSRNTPAKFARLKVTVTP